MPSTRPYIPRILLAFDFDGTLASDSIDAIVETYGLRRAEWVRDFEEPLGSGWDAIMRRSQALLDLAAAHRRPLTREVLCEAAARIRLFDGVLDMPAHLRELARGVHPEIELEFVVLSCGFAEIIDATEIRQVFGRVFASAFHFDREGRAVCMKRIIGHPEKALYLEAIAKDLEVDEENAPESSGRVVDEHEQHVPFDQMIYVGDGGSDLHAFGFMNSMGGLSIAIDKDDEFDHADEQLPGQRVDNIASPDYSQGTELLASLDHAVRACASRIALRAAGQGE